MDDLVGLHGLEVDSLEVARLEVAHLGVAFLQLEVALLELERFLELDSILLHHQYLKLVPQVVAR